ncbi:hypothetical protein [Alkalilimnicola ehrlichii]|uniref:hypothetical protein n=1 Tax=Alkalilimnicola ehrlichii TaxID=351052 RepID=UPI002162B6BD|nr:hypothetical protein [Alkalilimnicola ehrlichii]
MSAVTHVRLSAAVLEMDEAAEVARITTGLREALRSKLRRRGWSSRYPGVSIAPYAQALRCRP